MTFEKDDMNPSDPVITISDSANFPLSFRIEYHDKNKFGFFLRNRPTLYLAIEFGVRALKNVCSHELHFPSSFF